MKTMKKLLSLVLALSMVLSMAAVVFAAEGLPFTDVKATDWSYEAIAYAYENLLMNGLTSTTFGPKGTSTRAQVVTILHRVEGEPEATTEVKFEDVAPNAWFAKQVAWAAESGVVNGKSETMFAPDAAITRQELVTMLHRYADGKGYDVTAAVDLSTFADAASVAGYAKAPMAWAVALGLVKGDAGSDGVLRLLPDSNAERQALAAILQRFMGIYGPGTVNNPITLLETEAALTVAAGETVYYQGHFNGMNLNVTGAAGYTVTHNGAAANDVDGKVEVALVSDNPRVPTVFAITNNGQAEATYQASITYPVGSMLNPAAMVIGENKVVLEARDEDGYTLSWTAAEDGQLTITMPSDMGWSYVINNITTGSYGDSQWSNSDPVVNPAVVSVKAGNEIQINVNTYNPADAWNTPAGTITFTAAFAAGSVEDDNGGNSGNNGGGDEEKPEYVISETELSVGANSLTPNAAVTTTLYEFAPEEAGVYTFTAPEGALVGDWNTSTYPFDKTAEKTNTVKWECTSAGQSVLIGVSNVTGQFTLTVAKSEASEQKPPVLETVTYENQHTFTEGFNPLTGSVALVDVDVTEAHTAVLGEDGYYHLDSADGAILYLNFKNAEVNLYNACTNNYGALTMRGQLKDESGNVIAKYDFRDAMNAYVDQIDENGVYPLTEDLILFCQTYGADQGWYIPALSSFSAIKKGNADVNTAWMVLCCYVNG